MIGLDTNVVVRHLTDDDPDQSPIAHRIFEQLSDDEPGYLSFTTLLETHWVLRQSYRYPREVVAEVFESLLSTSDLVLEGADQVRQALRTARMIGRELPDVLVAQSGQRAGCDTTATFDRQALSIPGMSLAQ